MVEKKDGQIAEFRQFLERKVMQLGILGGSLFAVQFLNRVVEAASFRLRTSEDLPNQIYGLALQVGIATFDVLLLRKIWNDFRTQKEEENLSQERESIGHFTYYLKDGKIPQPFAVGEKVDFSFPIGKKGKYSLSIQLEALSSQLDQLIIRIQRNDIPLRTRDEKLKRYAIVDSGRWGFFERTGFFGHENFRKGLIHNKVGLSFSEDTMRLYLIDQRENKEILLASFHPQANIMLEPNDAENYASN